MVHEGTLRDKFEDTIHDAALREEGIWTQVQCAWMPLARACVCARAAASLSKCVTVRRRLRAGAPAIYTQRALRTLASLASGREIRSDAELLDGVAMVRV